MKNLNLACLSILFMVANNAQADAADGRDLHQENCVRCHSSDVYTRNNARVKDLPALGKQVRFCKNNLGISWFNEDVNDVVGFLNKTYYKF